MAINPNPAEGMRDLLPRDVQLRNHVIREILDVYTSFGFTQIETPCVEKIGFLSSGDGGENEKMLFRILKRGEKLNISTAANENDLSDLGLRYDLTVPLSRFYANNRAKLPTDFKVIQTGSVWRAERPQKGRYRQFTQCDIDIIGTKSVIAEIELILATSTALKRIGFDKFTVRINDRRILESFAQHCGFDPASFGKVFIILDKLDKIGIDGVRNELETGGFSTDAIPRFMDILDAASKKHLETSDIRQLIPSIDPVVLNELDSVLETVAHQSSNNFNLQFDLSLVRGMGYYTGQIFEVVIDGYSSSIAGGGRYDKMIGKILQGKEEIPACGFSIGFERVIAILGEQHYKVPFATSKIALLFSDTGPELNSMFAVAAKLREQGNIVSLTPQKKNTKKQLDDLAEQGFDSFAFYQPGADPILKQLNRQ